MESREARARQAGCPVVHFELSPRETVGHYLKQSAQLRDQGPILYNPMAQGFWVLTSHELVREMYQRGDLFSTEMITAWDPRPQFRMIPLNIDPPQHIKYRSLLNRWFSPAAVRQHEPRIREICRGHIERIAELGACDLVAEYAIRFPTEVFLELMSLPQTDAPLLVDYVEEFFRGYTGAEPGKAGTAYGSIQSYFRGKVEERRASPRDPEVDIISALLQARIDLNDEGVLRPLDEHEVLDICFMLVAAGLDTTRAQVGWMLFHFAANLDDRRRVLEDPSLIPGAVEEVLRYYTVVYGDGRLVTGDFEFHGCRFKKGDMVYGLTSAANRDPKYAEADRFIVDRQQDSNLAFAAGAHRCVGAHLARLELQITLEEWLRLVPDFSIATGGHPLQERGGQLTLMTLPLTWSGRTRVAQ